MSSFVSPLLTAPDEVDADADVDVESCPSEPVEELPPLELLDPAGAVVTPGLELEKPVTLPSPPQAQNPAASEARKNVGARIGRTISETRTKADSADAKDALLFWRRPRVWQSAPPSVGRQGRRERLPGR
jgi:hypothetical protein